MVALVQEIVTCGDGFADSATVTGAPKASAPVIARPMTDLLSISPTTVPSVESLTGDRTEQCIRREPVALVPWFLAESALSLRSSESG
jgi:hypothetical protein